MNNKVGEYIMLSLALRGIFGETITCKDSTDYVKIMFLVDDGSEIYYKQTISDQDGKIITIIEEVPKELVENYAIQNKDKLSKEGFNVDKFIVIT